MSKVRDMVRLNKRVVTYRDDYGWPVHIKSTRDSALATKVSSAMTKQMMKRAEKAMKPLNAAFKDVGTAAQKATASMETLKAVEPGTSVSNGRGTCPTCGKREKVRKDGTMCKHHGSYTGDQCDGTGQAAL